MRVIRVLSNVLSSSTGSPPGLCPLPSFILFGQSRHDRRHIVKYADDSVIVSFLSSDETEHGPVVMDFMDRGKSSILNINVSKMSEMCIDFKRKSLCHVCHQSTSAFLCLSQAFQF